MTDLDDWRFEQAEWVLTPSDLAFADWLDTEQRLATARALATASALTLLRTTGRTAA